MRRSGRRSFAAALLALASLLGVDAPHPALAEHPKDPHDGPTGVIRDRWCDIESPPSHTSGAACYTHTHSVHRRLDHYEHQERQGVVWVATQPRRTQVESCERNVVDDSATDHGMVPTNWCEPDLGDGWLDRDEPKRLRWKHVETEHAGSGHDVVWHPAATDGTNEAPEFQPATYHPPRNAAGEYEVACCGTWTRVATLVARDPNVMQVGGVWQDDLRFRSRSDNSNLGVSQLRDSDFLPGGGGLDVDVALSGVSPGLVWIDVDVRDLRATATDTIRIGPFRVLPDPNQAPTVSITAPSLTVAEDAGPALVTFTLSEPAPQRLTGTATAASSGSAEGFATAGDDFVAASKTLVFAPGASTATAEFEIVDDDVLEDVERFEVTGGLSGAGAPAGTATAAVEILDDDGYTLTAQKVSVDESAGEALVTFTVSPAAPADSSLTGTATSAQSGSGDVFATVGDDFDVVTRHLEFLPGATTAEASIPITDDALTEATEHFTVSARAAWAAAVDATVAIIDDDTAGGCAAGEHPSGPSACHTDHAPPPCSATAQTYDAHPDPSDPHTHGPVTLLPCGAGTPKSYAGYGTTVTEGATATVRFSVFPAPTAGETLTLGYDTVGGFLVRPGVDFTAVSGTLAFTDAASHLAVDVDTIDDSDVEALPETFTVRLLSAGSLVASAQVTILDNDGAPVGGGGGGGPATPCCGPFENPAPPVDRVCPGGSHPHNDSTSGWYCHDDHGSPTNPCADVSQTSVWTDPSSWSVGPCNYTGTCYTSNGITICHPPPPEPPCPTSFHGDDSEHFGYCHDHDTTPHDQCIAGRAQHWTEHTDSGHRRHTTPAACPPPTTAALGDVAAGGSRLIVFAGGQLILNIEVDVASVHVDKTRSLRVRAVTGCASPAPLAAGIVPTPTGCAIAGTHFVVLDRVIRFTSSTTQPYNVELDTLVTLDHGSDARRVEFRITDDEHPHMPAVLRSAWVQPPLRGTQ